MQVSFLSFCRVGFPPALVPGSAWPGRHASGRSGAHSAVGVSISNTGAVLTSLSDHCISCSDDLVADTHMKLITPPDL